MGFEYLKIYGKILLFLIVIAALVVAGMYFFKQEYDDEQFETIKTDMLLIEGKTKIIAEEVNMKKKDVSYVGKQLKEMKEDAEVRELQEAGIIDIDAKKKEYYMLDDEALSNLGLEDVKIEDGYYIVEYKDNEIIYSKGIEDANGNKLYKLSDMKNIE